MAEDTENKSARKASSKDRMMSPGQQSTASKQQRSPQPEWTKGLKRLYNSVVEEPLPDSFADLIAKLDADES